VSTISALIITKNEEKNIRDCLDSMRWVSEIVVVDAASKDHTIDIAKEFTQKIFNRPWDGYGAAKNFGLAQCTSDWILWLDADERVTAELQKEILEQMTSVDTSIAAMSMPRRANFSATGSTIADGIPDVLLACLDVRQDNLQKRKYMNAWRFMAKHYHCVLIFFIIPIPI